MQTLFRNVVKLLPTLLVSREKYQKKKLKQLLNYVSKNSPYYKELYRDYDLKSITPFNISILPPITKAQILQNYDQVVCDRAIKKNDVINFTDDLNNLDKLYLDKYIIDSTSGTTGEKLKVINSWPDFSEMMAMSAIYTWPKLSYAKDIYLSKRPVVYLVATDGYYASTLLSKTYLEFSKNYQSEIIDFRTPIEELVDKLNTINPILIGGYVSTFLTLAEEANAGRLKIDVKYMVGIGTNYTNYSRNFVKNAFNCKTFTSYSCTEGGEIGCECEYQHFHLSKNVIVEAANDLLQPIEDGKQSDCLLITNLWNKTMPFIRYRLNDRCIIHNEPCKCGCKDKWIEVIGREATRVDFINNQGKTVQFTDFMFELILNDVCQGGADHQLIINDDNIELRFNIQNDFVKFRQFNEIKRRLLELSNKNNLDMKIVLSNELPVVEVTGKVKRILINKEGS